MNPAERPTNLSELVEQLRSAPAAEQEKADEPKAPPHRKRRVVLALAGAAVLIAAIAGYFAFSRRPAPSATDDFDEAFSLSGIYEAPRQ